MGRIFCFQSLTGSSKITADSVTLCLDDHSRSSKEGLLNLPYKQLWENFMSLFWGVSYGPSAQSCLCFTKLISEQRGLAWLSHKVILQFYDSWCDCELLAGFWSGCDTHFSPPFLRGISWAELLAGRRRNVHLASPWGILVCGCCCVSGSGVTSR